MGVGYGRGLPLRGRRLPLRGAPALVGKKTKKGGILSFFQIGGSDCVVVFERKANVTVTATADVHYPIRSRYAVSGSHR